MGGSGDDSKSWGRVNRAEHERLYDALGRFRAAELSQRKYSGAWVDKQQFDCRGRASGHCAGLSGGQWRLDSSDDGYSRQLDHVHESKCNVVTERAYG